MSGNDETGYPFPYAKIPTMKCHYCGNSELNRYGINLFHCSTHACPVYMRFVLTDTTFGTIGVSLLVSHNGKPYEMYMAPISKDATYQLILPESAPMLHISPISSIEGFGSSLYGYESIYQTDRCMDLTPDNAQTKLATYLTFL